MFNDTLALSSLDVVELACFCVVIPSPLIPLPSSTLDDRLPSPDELFANQCWTF